MIFGELLDRPSLGRTLASMTASLTELLAPADAAGQYNAAVDLMDRNVVEGRSARVACIDPQRRLTYAELPKTATGKIQRFRLREPEVGPTSPRSRP